jgi:4'-phosphopantetheinyl transferase
VELAERFFSADEAAALRNLDPARREEAFFSLWTRKEAYLKARGDGLSRPLASFSVGADAAAEPGLIASDLGEAEQLRWTIRPLELSPGWAGAVAAEGRDWSLETWSWRPDP